jgi:phosphatidylethanolamine-binding protein (PEBP) family uncharacterized protein
MKNDNFFIGPRRLLSYPQDMQMITGKPDNHLPAFLKAFKGDQPMGIRRKKSVLLVMLAIGFFTAGNKEAFPNYTGAKGQGPQPVFLADLSAYYSVRISQSPTNATNFVGSNGTILYLPFIANDHQFFEPLSLISNAGVDGGTLPSEYTCDGTGSSPALSWSNAPAGTKEFALMMTTIPVDGPTKWNWVLYGLSGSSTNLAKNSSGVGILGVSSRGTRVYEPPCSQGPGAKIYTFTLFALSAPPTLPVAAGQVTGEVLTKAISSITLGSASLNLSYTRAQ